MVFQDHKLLLDRPIYDNVALPLVVAGTPLKEVDRRVRAALDQVGLLGRERSSPLELSVGEQQRVGIARAVISKPQLLIADEPTGNLDPALSRRSHARVQALPGSRRHRDRSPRTIRTWSSSSASAKSCSTAAASPRIRCTPRTRRA